jgi:phasin family protein
MTKPSNPFPKPDFTKMAAKLKEQGIDIDEIATMYRKNVEAITSASQAAVEGVQRVAKRQAEMLRESMEEYGKLLRDLSLPTTAKEAVAKQADIAKHTLETTLAHMREISEMIAKSSNEALDVINKRGSEMLEEIKALAERKKKEG